MDAAVALQRKKTLKFLCIVDFPLSKQGIFFVTLKHKTVMKKLSQSFLLYCRAKKSAALRMLLISLQLKGKLLAETLIFD